MTRVFVHGLGAVSPAGWDLCALRASLASGAALPVQSIPRPGWEKPLAVRIVPQSPTKLPFLAHARLRRASPMAHYTVSAALEAIGSDATAVAAGRLRLGIIVCTMTGGLSYSRRFYQEVIKDPATASPLIFPETVFNAPASHLSAYLNTDAVNYSMVGDGGTYLQGLAVAAQWLDDGTAQACLVIGAEEMDWTAADALRLFDRKTILSTGAGALYLKTKPATVELTAVTDSFSAPRTAGRHKAARRMRAQLPSGSKNELLCSNESHCEAWNDWPGAVVNPKDLVGEAFAASAAWQCVAACDAIQHHPYDAANVSLTGAGRQTIGARFARVALLKDRLDSLT